MRPAKAFRPQSSTVRSRLLTSICLLAASIALQPAHAQDAPPISPSLKQALSNLPIAEIKGELQSMAGDLKKTKCGGNLKGCYMTQSGPLQLYFFTSGESQQTLLLVADKKMAMPRLLGEKVQKVMGETSLSAPIISISTTDYELDQISMPPALQKVVRDSYFNINTLSFSSGVQLAARASLSGPIKLTMESMGVKSNQLMMRAAVVMPIPTDLASGAGTGAGAANAAAHGDTLQKAGTDAMKPEAFVEFQFAPNATLQLTLPRVTLTDASFFLNNALTFGFKGNAAFKGAENKKVIMHFQTPLTPAGGMDLLDFAFRMATPANFTMEDAAHMMVAMASPDPRLAKYGGGFIRNIESFKDPLLAMTKPLSVVQLRNPVPPPEYRFGDSNTPFPNDNKYFNVVLLGPLADGGPLMNGAGDVTILGQKMGWLATSAGQSGLSGDVGESVTLKLGPLGKVTFKMQATLAINANKQDVSLLGNFAGQKVSVGMSGSTMKVEVSASCVNPFEIKTQVAIKASTNIADVFEGQGGVNVDPAKIGGCIGKELEAAYHKVAGEFSHLGGYTASAANAELNKIANAAEAEYNQAKQQARKAAESSINAVNKTWNSVASAFGVNNDKADYNEKTIQFMPFFFDWDYYYDQHPDLVKNKVDLVAHWDQIGYPSGWRGSLEFDGQFYSKAHPNTNQGPMGNAPPSPFIWMMNFSLYGQGRQSSADFDVKSYLARYPDLQRDLGVYGYDAALSHWLTTGKALGRDGRPYSTLLWTIGNAKGSLLDDYRICKGQHVIGFRLRAKKFMADTRLLGIQFLYPNGWGAVYGTLGNPPYSSEVKLPANQYFNGVHYRTNGGVDGLRFTSNTGKNYGMGGGNKDFKARSMPSGQKLSCMAGRSGEGIQQLIFSSTK